MVQIINIGSALSKLFSAISSKLHSEAQLNGITLPPPFSLTLRTVNITFNCLIDC
jgi:hypothetical protein